MILLWALRKQLFTNMQNTEVLLDYKTVIV